MWRQPLSLMKHILARIAASRLAWVVTGFLLFYTLVGFLLAPFLAERYLPRYVEKHVGQQASIGNIRINPYLYIVEVSRFSLIGADGNDLLKLNRLYVDFELWSSFAKAWTFRDIRVEGLDLLLEVDREGRINVLELLEKLKRPERPDQPPPSLILENLVLSDANIRVNDLSGASPVQTTFGPVDLELLDFSTLPEREGRYSLSAKLPGGGALTWAGSMTTYPISSSGEFSIRGMELATPWKFLRDELAIAEPSGQLGLRARYDFSYKHGKAMLQLNDLWGDIENLVIAPPGVNPALLTLDVIRMGEARFDSSIRELIVPSLHLANGNVSASRADDGSGNWQKLWTGTPGTGTGAEEMASGSSKNSSNTVNHAKSPPPMQPPWHVLVENLSLAKMGLTYTDRTLSPAAAFRAEEISSNFSVSVTWGQDSPALVIKDLLFAGRKVALEPAIEGESRAAKLNAVNIAGGRLNSSARTIGADNVILDGADISIRRDRNGLEFLLGSVPDARFISKEKSIVSLEQPATGVESGETPWKYHVRSLELLKSDLHLADQSFTPPIKYDLDLTVARLENIDSESKSPIAFATEFGIGEQASVTANGSLQQDFQRATGKLNAKNIPLEPLQPLLAHYAKVNLVSGALSISTNLEYEANTASNVTARGSASLHNIKVNEAGADARLISAKTVAAKGIEFDLKRNRLAISEVHLLDPGMKLVIDEDRNVNLNEVLKSGGTGERVNSTSSDRGKTKSADPAFDASLGRIRITNGSLDFADLSLVLPFSTHVHALEGSVVGISTALGSRAEIEIVGQVERYGEAKASGSLIPTDPRKFLDIKADLENVGMPALSPYSATFAGRKIAAGDLWLTLHYKIADGHLLGEHRVILTDFKLGERIESPSALDLPLDLAVALLKSPDGTIKIAVPVEGNLGNPAFDYGKVIRSALTNVVQRIVSAPFRALGSLLGSGDEEELSKVVFDPGSARVDPVEREKLDNLAQALKERPQLRVKVQGAYDPDRDGQSLKSDHVRRDLAAEMGVELNPQEAPGLVAYGDARTQKALEKLLVGRAGKKAVTDFAKGYESRTGRAPEHVNPLLGLFGRGSEDRAFYAALFEHLVEQHPPLDEQLKTLAEDRAEAILDVLSDAGIDRRRLEARRIERVPGKKGEPIVARLLLQVQVEESKSKQKS